MCICICVCATLAIDVSVTDLGPSRGVSACVFGFGDGEGALSGVERKKSDTPLRPPTSRPPPPSNLPKHRPSLRPSRYYTASIHPSSTEAPPHPRHLQPPAHRQATAGSVPTTPTMPRPASPPPFRAPPPRCLSVPRAIFSDAPLHDNTRSPICTQVRVSAPSCASPRHRNAPTPGARPPRKSKAPAPNNDARPTRKCEGVAPKNGCRFLAVFRRCIGFQ